MFLSKVNYRCANVFELHLELCQINFKNVIPYAADAADRL